MSSETGGSPSGLNLGPPNTQTKYWLIFGAVFAAAAFVLLIVAFFAPDNSCDRWTLLKFIMPLFSGVAAGAFTGAISAQGSLGRLVVAGTGGFAVYLISLLAVGEPRRCEVPRIENFKKVENQNAEGPRSKRVPHALNPKTDPYEITGNEDFVLFLGAVIGNVYSVGKKVDFTITVTGLDANDKVAWVEREHVQNLDSWKTDGKIVQRWKPEEIQKFFEVSDNAGKYIMLWGIECFTEDEIGKWSGKVEITVQDNKMAQPPAGIASTITEYLSIGARPTKTLLPGSSGCQANT
ncbi:hypothetical protein [Bradyrhizobium sp. SZCCHNR1093]|uniref:hypothetical protein n=1 Tax=Bradyrhizobium sp. SZCCHNR1093 TaxID=3057368 RepID=UPI0028F0669D|nr:hypothetical protein [Bradyrhizobium sp. SZCCHNR1093]